MSSGKLDIQGYSPFNRFASNTARLSLCFKGVCDTSIYVGGVLGSCAITDELLKLRGHRAVIMPFIAKIVVPASPLVKLHEQRSLFYNHLKMLDTQLSNSEEELDLIKKFSDNGVINEKDAERWTNDVNKRNEKINSRQIETMDKILNNSSNLNNNIDDQHQKFLKRIENIKNEK